MAERSSEAREMNQAADRITGADEEADRVADVAVQQARRQIAEEERDLLRESAPTPEEVRVRRDERRRREGYPGYQAS